MARSDLDERADGQDADDLAVVQLADLGDKADVVHHLLGADLLEDANHQVCEDDAEEEQVTVLPCEEDEHGHGEVHAVEEGEGVLGENLPDALGLDVRVGINAAVGHALGNLLVGEPAQGGVLALHVGPLSLVACETHSAQSRAPRAATGPSLTETVGTGPMPPQLLQISKRDAPPGGASQDCDGAPRGIRTHDLTVRSRSLYPTELRTHICLSYA